MMQTTFPAEPVHKAKAPFWPIIISIGYFFIITVLILTIIGTVAVIRNNKTIMEWEFLIAAIIAFVCDYFIVRFLTETSMRNSRERLSLAHRSLYYTTATIGWLATFAFPASLVWAVLMFSGLEFKPHHPPAIATQPAIEAR